MNGSDAVHALRPDRRKAFASSKIPMEVRIVAT